jgi:hypothetical protein
MSLASHFSVERLVDRFVPALLLVLGLGVSAAFAATVGVA